MLPATPTHPLRRTEPRAASAEAVEGDAGGKDRWEGFLRLPARKRPGGEAEKARNRAFLRLVPKGCLLIDLLDMLATCLHHSGMPKMIQLRNVPEDLHRTLKVRAAQAGKTLSDYLIEEIRCLAERPTREEMEARLMESPRRTYSVSPTEILRQERDAL